MTKIKALAAAATLFSLSNISPLQADDLVTRDGTTYHDYKVISHDAGYVTILHSNGGGQIPLSQLPDTLQKQLGYDPVTAAATVKADDAQLRASRIAIEHEEEKQDIKRRKDLDAAAKKLPAPK